MEIYKVLTKNILMLVEGNSIYNLYMKSINISNT
jgi:hypothetical protein